MSIWTRLRRFFAAPDQPSHLVTYDPSAMTGTASDPVILSSAGNVFSFHVIPHFIWAGRMSMDRLKNFSDQWQAQARSDLLRRIWPISRDFQPIDLAGVELKINESLAPWCYDTEHGELRCTPSVRVLLDPAVRERVLPLEGRRLELAVEHSLGLLKAGHVRERVEAWLEVVRSLEHLATLGPDERRLLAPAVAALVDGEFARVMQSLAATREQRSLDLITVLTQASGNHGQLGLYEFADAYDKAVRSFCKQAGISYGSLVDDRT
ncbi:hypothetical protein Aple_055260 [Acrocarpospora pleiomorpha]|uniref:Uncharacterized protein n=1 Tax=Acrocarpospora pleiomorpha TaxID=90975 RepID=A0A5M3XWC1_9ACTN|nr:hypothetical protein [Acrocarpospora pleiomorpha]GES22628.1 hypothetical protein Aple_055260 [Acrocarpospora pleiomorpha]